ncbi:FAD-binding oxidoreductase [Microbacterium sp. ARD32]|uniref:FAD-binding oxidoreductase n=1 Tax=Microbacterium sp. ARD32 TaxID=2962577 RepID=UPI002881810E|nr:FAD-binding oxidoreductase [Microbacterium sp. ARD32]MDT0156905.1 FAD-binding oxidoreductase [Microbacterium sp. ARD32]
MRKEQLDALRTEVSGPVLTPQDDGFAQECSGFDLALAHSPELVLGAASEADVRAGVRFAARFGLTVRVQATGHGIGIPAAGGMLITTTRMRGVRVDPVQRTAIVQAGCRWRDVIDAAASHGLAALNGSSTDVGVVGYTLGGGLSPLGRAFGFTSDLVRRLRLVDAAGEVHVIDAQHEPETFWALRGGKCEIGVVTELEFELLDLPGFYGGGLFFAGEHIADVLEAFRTWSAGLPDESCASVAILRLPPLPDVPEPLRGVPVAHLRFIHVGDPVRGAELVAPMRACAPLLIDAVGAMPYRDIAAVHRDPEQPMPVWDAGTLLTAFPAEAAEAMLEAAGSGRPSPLTIVELRQLGGALARPVDSAVGGRDAAFAVTVIGVCPPGAGDAVEAAGLLLLDALAPWSSGGANINFQGARTAADAIRRAWPAATVTRLLRVKQQWDPDRRFRFGHSLEPLDEQETTEQGAFA